MRLIDADELKKKLLKIRADIVDKNVARGSSKSDAWIAAYLLILDEYIKILDEMPSEVQHYDCNHDCDAIYEAYNRGFSKGREMEEQAKKQMKDYCKNDCDATEETWKALNMTREEIWDKIIQDLKTLDQEAKDEDYVPYMTDALVLTASQLYLDDTNGHIRKQDKADMWSLIDKLGNYSIKSETIRYLPEYQEIKKLVKKVL